MVEEFLDLSAKRLLAQNYQKPGEERVYFDKQVVPGA